jgi:endonuclease-3
MNFLSFIMDRKTALRQLKFLKSKGKDMRLAADGWLNDWQRLVAILLSARTRDEVTILVCEKMFDKYPTPEKFSKLKLGEIKKLIGSINFYNNKSKMLFEMTKDVMKKFEGQVPREIEKMTTLSGVGRKTANVFLAQDGGAHIGVDTHVNYISNYLGWANSEDPLKVEIQLMELFPKSKWGELNDTLVRFGKTYTSRREKDMWLDYFKEKVK